MPTEERFAQMYFMPIGPTPDRESVPLAAPSKASYESFYTAYGECFSAWSGVELNLLPIYMFALDVTDASYRAASAAFYSTTGFRAKLHMVDAAIRSSKRVIEEDLAIWKKYVVTHRGKFVIATNWHIILCTLADFLREGNEQCLSVIRKTLLRNPDYMRTT